MLLEGKMFGFKEMFGFKLLEIVSVGYDTCVVGISYSF